MYGTQLLGHLGDHAVNLLPAGDVGHEREDAPVGLAAQLAGGCLQISLVSRNDRHLDPFAGQLSCDGFADTSTPARYDGPLALQSEVHGSFSPLSGATIPVQPPGIVLRSGLGRKCDASWQDHWGDVSRDRRLATWAALTGGPVHD